MKYIFTLLVELVTVEKPVKTVAGGFLIGASGGTGGERTTGFHTGTVVMGDGDLLFSGTHLIFFPSMLG